MKLLLLGAGGRLGAALLPELARVGDVYASTRRPLPASAPPRWLSLDGADAPAVEAVFRSLHPDVVINAAAYTNVDGAEDDPDAAYRSNVEAPRAIAAAAARYNVGLIHFSTDYVFDGRGTRPWREDDAAAPLNVYGKTKWQGEQALYEAPGGANIIVRSSWVYGLDGSGFVKAILEQASQRSELHVVDDQIGAPTSAALLARMTAAMVERLGPVREGRWRRFRGVYHVASRGEISRCGWAEEIVAAALRARLIRPVRITPVATAHRPSRALRPLNSRLDVSKFLTTWGADLPFWDADLREQMPQILEAARSNSSIAAPE